MASPGGLRRTGGGGSDGDVSPQIGKSAVCERGNRGDGGEPGSGEGFPPGAAAEGEYGCDVGLGAAAIRTTDGFQAVDATGEGVQGSARAGATSGGVDGSEDGREESAACSENRRGAGGGPGQYAQHHQGAEQEPQGGTRGGVEAHTRRQETLPG